MTDSPATPAAPWPYEPILVIGPLPPPQHGVATCMRDIVALERDGVPLLIVDSADRRGLENIGRLDLQNVWLGLKHGSEVALEVARGRPSVVFLFISQGPLAFLRDLLFVAPAALTGRTLVIQLQGGYFRKFYEESAGWMRALIRWCFRRADRVLVLGEQLKPIFDGLVVPDRLDVLPNAVETGTFMRANPVRTERPVVAYLATVSRDKGAIDLMRAVPAIRRAVPDVRVRIAGEVATREERAEIEQLLDEEGLRDTIELVGVLTGDAKTRFLGDADVFVFPTRYPYEGHPYVLLEAMASGLPVVTTNQGCITETVRDGDNGRIVKQGDVAGIAEATIELLHDPSVRAAMGARNAARARELYDVRVWRARLLEIMRTAHERRLRESRGA